MSDLAKQRRAIAEARFDDYQFGWDIEEAHHWHHDAQRDELRRTVLFCADSPGDPCVRGEFVVRFLTKRPFVDECYAVIDGCLVGQDPGAMEILRKAS
jgi:hypothetical protein